MLVSLAKNHDRRRSWFMLAVLLSSLLAFPGCRGDRSEEKPAEEIAEEETDDVAKVPAWVHTSPESDDLLDRFTIHSGFWATSEETNSEYMVTMNRRLRSHIDGCLNLVAGRNDAHQLVLYELEQFEDLVHVTGPYLETRDSPSLQRPMYQLHSLVEVDTTLDQEMARRWRYYEGRHRVRQLALGWLAVVGLISIVFVHLRFPGQGIIARKRTWLSLGLVTILLGLLVLLGQWVQWI